MVGRKNFFNIEHLFRDLNLSQVQIDELWTVIKKDKNLNPEDDCEKVGTKWVLIAEASKNKAYHQSSLG